MRMLSLIEYSPSLSFFASVFFYLEYFYTLYNDIYYTLHLHALIQSRCITYATFRVYTNNKRTCDYYNVPSNNDTLRSRH